MVATKIKSACNLAVKIRQQMWPGEGSTVQWKSPLSPGSLKALLFPPLLNKVENKGTQGVRARYDAELPPFIPIVRYPGRPVILGMEKVTATYVLANFPKGFLHTLKRPERGFKFLGHVLDRFSDIFIRVFQASYILFGGSFVLQACRPNVFFSFSGSELMVIWRGWFETAPCRATLATPFPALCPRILGTRFTNYQPNDPAEVQCEFFGPISGLNFETWILGGEFLEGEFLRGPLLLAKKKIRPKNSGVQNLFPRIRA